MADISVLRGRKLSVEGARLIGTGFFSNVYMIAEDTVVKVLKSGDPEDAEREILLSKWALKNGIPTAISFDVVDVDGHPGLVYESLGRNNMRNELRDHPEKFDELMQRYVSLLKTINSVTAEDDRLPKALDEYMRKLEDIRGILTEDEYVKMKALLCTVPDRSTLVHRDCQVKNIKLRNDELYLIDLDTLSLGDPIFELMALYCCYRLFVEMKKVDYDEFFELSAECLSRIWDAILRLYFAGLPEDDISDNEEKIKLLAYLHMLHFIVNNFDSDPDKMLPMYEGFKKCLTTVEDLRLKF